MKGDIEGYLSSGIDASGITFSDLSQSANVVFSVEGDVKSKPRDTPPNVCLPVDTF